MSRRFSGLVFGSVSGGSCLASLVATLAVVGAAGCGGPTYVTPDEPAQGAAAVGTNTKKPVAPSCDASVYPCGPFGYGVGEVIANLQFYGRRNNDPAQMVTAQPDQLIKLSDYYKDKSIKVIAVLVAAEWCGPCQAEQPELISTFTDYATAKKGVAFVEAIIQRKDGSPADLEAVDRWSNKFRIPFDMVADPTVALGPYYSVAAFPMQLIIQTSDMTIQAQNNGYNQGWLKSTVDGLLPQ